MSATPTLSVSLTLSTTYQKLSTLLATAYPTITNDAIIANVGYFRNTSGTISCYVAAGYTSAPSSSIGLLGALQAVDFVEGMNANDVWLKSASGTPTVDFWIGAMSGAGPRVTGVIGTLTGTDNTVPKASSGNLVDSSIVDDGATVAISEPVAVTGAITATSSIKSSSATAGIGYATGSGGAVTQATDKSTGVTSNHVTTAITMNAASLAASTIVSFTFTNSAIAATDQVVVTHQSAGTSGAYILNAFPGSGSAVISVNNVTLGALAEAIVLRVNVYKSVSA